MTPPKLAQTLTKTPAQKKVTKPLGNLVNDYLKDYFHHEKNAVTLCNMYDTVIREVEKPLITLVLKETKGNQTKTAQVLGINRNTLRKKIVDLKIPL